MLYDRSSDMSRVRKIVAILSLTGAGLAYAAHEVPINPEQMELLGISVVQVERAASLVTDRLPARVVIPPQQERVVSAPLGGLVTGLRAVVGDEVDAGEELALIESPTIIGVQRDFLQALTEEKLAATQLDRDQPLHKEGIIAERRYLETRSSYEHAVATLEERRQALALSGMDDAAIDALAKTRKMSGILTVRASAPGVVLESLAVVGQRVEQAGALFHLAQLDPLWLEIRVPLHRLEGVEPDAGVEVPCPQTSARVNLIGRNVDPASQTVLVRAEVHAVGDCLRPGQYIQVRLQLGSVGQLFRIPTSAVVHTSARTIVFVRAPFGFLATRVTVAGEKDGYSIVSGELSEAAFVAVSGMASIKSTWMGLGGDAE